MEGGQRKRGGDSIRPSLAAVLQAATPSSRPDRVCATACHYRAQRVFLPRQTSSTPALLALEFVPALARPDDVLELVQHLAVLCLQARRDGVARLDGADALRGACADVGR